VAWAADGKSLFAIGWRAPNQCVLQIDLNGRARVILNESYGQLFHDLLVSPDGQHLALSQQMLESNAWLLDNF
jgi:hypothetical protein